MLKFPVGAINPREPLFDWMNAILGLVFAPFFGGNAVVAGAWFLDLQGPLWAALEVFPVYLIGREVSSRRTGLIAALILPFLSASITSSTFGYANYLSFYTFMILVVVYSYLRTVKALGTHRYVESYRKPEQYLPALRAFLRQERTGVKWAVFTGVALGALALSWQGYTYAIVVIGVGLLVAMIAERIRRVDSFSLYVATWIIGLVAFPMMTPYYFVQGDLPIFFDLPVLLFFGVLALMLPFLLVRDIPWVFSIPFLVLLVGGATLFLKVFVPRYFTDIVTGQGYFVKTLIYSTVAEAQPPSFDALVLGYGVVTFFLAFVGLAIFVYLLVRHRFKRYHIGFLVYAIVSVYLPISATKFFLVGSPVYALLAAEAVHRALDVGSYPELRRTVASLSDRRSQFAAFRRAFKVRHAVVLALVVAVVLPNVWVAIDAGIPSNTKDHIATQINLSIPSWLKLNSSEPAANYLGATGTSLDTPNQYDSAAYNWLNEQDTNVPEPYRPAFVSWWDYGFQAIDQGGHPSVADNFQNGIDPAGQFLLAQNESQAIGILATTLLSAEETTSHSSQLPAALDAILTQDGVNVTTLQGLLVHQGSDYQLVVAHPGKYLPVDPTTITDDNAMYLAVSYFLADSLPLSGVAKVYDSLQAYTGWSIRYAMADSRLFPFSGSDTGIYYAPADLTGRVINDAGLPTTFFNVTVLGSNNNTYALGSVPATVAAEQYQINYFAPFYNSMIYRTYIGYNGTDVGLSGGIPGLEGAAASDPIEPGWMLQHFQIVYRTAYYCPGVKDAKNGSSCMLAGNLPDARALANSTNGTFDSSAISYFQGGETMLAYYPGETLDGTVTLPDGTPDAGVRVTVYDSWHTPHMTAVTGTAGNFTLVLPPGNDTVNITTGALDGLTQAGSTVLRSVKITVPESIGYSFDAPVMVARYGVVPGILQGTVYWNNANNSSYQPSVDSLIPGAQVVFKTGPSLSTLTATTDASGSYLLANVPPGNYTFTVRYHGESYNETAALVAPGATVNASAGLTPGTISGNVTGPNGAGYVGAAVTLADSAGTVATVTSSSGGDYGFTSVGLGNYTVTAAVAGTLLRSAGAPVTITSVGQAATVPLTLQSMAPVAVEVVSAASPVGGIAVRFAPLLSFVSAGTSGLNAVDSVTSNGAVAITGADGEAISSLPVGNYSVYALGYVGATLSAGLGTLAVPANGLPASATISLSPAVALSGVVAQIGSHRSTAVIADPTTGGEIVARATTNGSFSLRVPAGRYDLLALEGTSGSSGTTDVALAQVNVTGPVSVPMTPTAGTVARFAVYANLTTDSTFPVAGAVVNVSAGPGGPSIEQVDAPNGSVTFFVPSSVPLSSGGYCISGTAPGYVPSQICGIAPSAMANLSVFRLAVASIPVTLSVVGLPTGTSILVNLTGESPTAVNRSYFGGPRFSFTLPPGTYGVGAYAVIGNGTVIYQPSTVLSTVIPFGARSSALTLYVIPEITARGTLSLPSGTAANNTTVALSSPFLNVTVNGTAYLAGFRVAPGNYTAAVNATGASGALANLTEVTVSPGGVVSPRLVLTTAAVTLSGTLAPVGNSSLRLNGTVTLTTAKGATVVVTAKNGQFSARLPINNEFAVHANFTVLTSGANGSYETTWSVVPGTTCTVGTSGSTCSVPLTGTIDRAWLNGTVERFGGSGPIPSSLRLIGPYPSTSLTVVEVPNGSFSLRLMPGAYYLYATPSDGSPYAGFATALALPYTTGNLTILLTPSWTDQVLVVGSGAPGQTIGPANLTVTGTSGARLMYTDVAPGTTVPIALPAGAYTLDANATGTLNGVAGNATATSSIVIGQGNLGTRLELSVAPNAAVTASLAGPRSSNVTAGGSATFSFSVRDSGNVPVTVHPVGSPAFWTFNFSVANLSLVPGGKSATGEVRITVPAGTAVGHPTVAITFELANGTQVGNVTPAPTINVAAYHGIAVGPTPAHATSVGFESAQVSFYVHDSGNVPEQVRLAVSDAHRLAGIGWSYSFGASSGNDSPRVTNLSAGGNQTFSVNLTFVGTTFVAPGSVTISASVLNVSQPPTASVTLRVAVSQLTVSTANGGPVTVTGPGIGSPSKYLPEWELAVIALVPAVLLLGVIVGRRWWKTRRWTHR
jgi:dolichyl-diphosphooligosaccharide--protein glycosyltransferase